ncbi:hypothetical protein AB9P05_09830 [Roseivirga sp. BDSF3-8]|uniref:hypothetical protein n=1 Tax=Roseivirga sp. BDSF3-8 TaxID=3241598 RepID=UPI003531D196
MKKDKLSLKTIAVESFRTSARPNLETIRGGYENSNCRTECFDGCISAAESGCNSCDGGGTGGGGGTGLACGTDQIVSCYVAC